MDVDKDPVVLYVFIVDGILVVIEVEVRKKIEEGVKEVVQLSF